MALFCLPFTLGLMANCHFHISNPSIFPSYDRREEVALYLLSRKIAKNWPFSRKIFILLHTLLKVCNIYYSRDLDLLAITAQSLLQWDHHLARRHFHLKFIKNRNFLKCSQSTWTWSLCWCPRFGSWWSASFECLL